jgi:signal transduction histidine kinase
MDRGLIGQASFAFLGGGLLVTLALAWAFRRLENAHRQLREQSADLVRANQELDFAAKTSALGTISAHLIHGLKNPLAGLESFVADGASANDDDSGEAWKTAKETAVRLRAMVDEVVTVLGDEATGGGDHEVPSPEIINAAKARTADKARKAGIEISIVPGSDGMVTGRVANLVGLVLANLIGNAVEASAHGQRITVEARPNGSDVEFLVSDTGSGLPDNVRVNLFRPVRSSKAGGSGMGLAISHRLAKHAGGKLELIRTDRNGTAFRLLVPALER